MRSATPNGNSNYPRWEDHSIIYNGKLFITEQVIKINYTILYKLLYHLIFRSCHHDRAKRAYETVHHHIHAILQDSLPSSVWRLRLSFSVLYADCWRWRRHIGPVQYVGGREADEHPCAHSFPQPFVSRTITNIYTNILINLHCFYLSQEHFHKSNRLRCQCKWLAVDHISMHRITPYIKPEFADI